jgi:hypothetical protein
MTLLDKVRILLSKRDVLLHYCSVDKDFSEIREISLDEAIRRSDSNRNNSQLLPYAYRVYHQDVYIYVRNKFLELEKILERSEKIDTIIKDDFNTN